MVAAALDYMTVPAANNMRNCAMKQLDVDDSDASAMKRRCDQPAADNFTLSFSS
jgi:hypothetical protein